MADILTAVLLPLAGVLAAFYPPSDTGREKVSYLAGFVALSVLAIVLLRRQRADDRRHEAKEREHAVKEIRKVMREEFAEARRIEAEQKGVPPAERKPSPRFEQLVWREQVLSGESPSQLTPAVIAQKLLFLWGAGDQMAMTEDATVKELPPK